MKPFAFLPDGMRRGRRAIKAAVREQIESEVHEEFADKLAESSSAFRFFLHLEIRREIGRRVRDELERRFPGHGLYLLRR